MKIRFCSNNIGKSDLLRKISIRFPRLCVSVDDCLKKCGICRKKPFFIINGEIFSADSFEELEKSIEIIVSGKSRD